MKLKPQYALRYDEDDICIVERLSDGTEREVTSLTASAAMAIEGMERGLTRDTLIDSIAQEFDGADRDMVAADLEGLTAQLLALGFMEA